jgi:hypothetical protein
VLFFALVSVAGLSGATEPPDASHASGLLIFFLREVGGGVGLGLGLGYVGYRALLSIDDHPLELQITLALAVSLCGVVLDRRVWPHRGRRRGLNAAGPRGAADLGRHPRRCPPFPRETCCWRARMPSSSSPFSCGG